MPVVKRQVEEGYIVVHHLYGDHKAIEFLRSTSRDVLERLCFKAKKEGEASFTYNDDRYILVRNPDASYSVFREEDRPEGVEYLNR